MRFMVVESFRDQDAKAVYCCFRDYGRQMPDGLTFIDSWVAAEHGHCLQLVEADDPAMFQQWIAQWSDLMAIEVAPGTAGKDIAAALSGLLDQV